MLDLIKDLVSLTTAVISLINAIILIKLTKR